MVSNFALKLFAFKTVSYLLSLSAVTSIALSQTYNIPLDDFANALDSVYSYIDTSRHNGTNVLNMRSQMWLNETYADRPIWWHWLILIKFIPENEKMWSSYW